METHLYVEICHKWIRNVQWQKLGGVFMFTRGNIKLFSF